MVLDPEMSVQLFAKDCLIPYVLETCNIETHIMAYYSLICSIVILEFRSANSHMSDVSQ